MTSIRLEIKEIEYLHELVSEAWYYKRPSKLTEKEQEVLALELSRALKE